MVESIKELKRICHNNARFTDRPWWYRLYRETSIRLTRLILLSGIEINPNYITLLEVVMGITGSLLLLSSKITITMVGFIFLFGAYLFDCMDGELARYYKKVSSAGSYLDEVGHALVDPLLFAVLALNVYFSSPNTLVVLMGFLTAFLIRFIKTDHQLKAFIFIKEFTSSADIFLNSIVEKEGKKKGNIFLGRILVIVNSLKHYVITIFIFLVAFLLDYFKDLTLFIPFLEYKVIALSFYSIFLGVVALAQIVLNFKNIDRDKFSLFQKVEETMKEK